VILATHGDEAGQHLQSIILGVALLVGSLLSFALGVLADLQRTNRILLEESIEQTKILRYGAPYPIRALPAHRSVDAEHDSDGG
jgi:hypothetical protein